MRLAMVLGVVMAGSLLVPGVAHAASKTINGTVSTGGGWTNDNETQVTTQATNSFDPTNLI